MNAQNLELARGLVDAAYIDQGALELRKREALVRVLLSQRSIPQEGWDEVTIEAFLRQLSTMDSNNFLGAVGGGEREGRVSSSLVRLRHYGFGHGIGRSGDIAAVQPKAAGSSLLYKLTNRLVLHAVQQCGVTRATSALVMPMATGMTIALVLLAIRKTRPSAARYVVWPRIDQKSCLKAISAAGCTPLVVENSLSPGSDELRAPVASVEGAIASAGGPENIVAVVTTSSCFAPRGCDDLVATAELCARLNVPHVVNHAYGLQAGALCAALNDACGPAPTSPPAAHRKAGSGKGPADARSTAPFLPAARRVDAFVSSTDKNFLVPVGGAIVAAPAGSPVVEAVARSYPGRASLSPILDVFVTLLGLGQKGLRGLLQQRKAVAVKLKAGLAALAASCGERVLDCPHNPISYAMTLGNITCYRRREERGVAADGQTGDRTVLHAFSSAAVSSAASLPSPRVDALSPTYLGSMLFSRGVSGTRVVPVGERHGEERIIDGHTFTGFGAHCDAYPVPYLTVAAAIGMTEVDVDVLITRLSGAIQEFRKQREASG